MLVRLLRACPGPGQARRVEARHHAAALVERADRIHAAAEAHVQVQLRLLVSYLRNNQSHETGILRECSFRAAASSNSSTVCARSSNR